jgi:hypothetical protein
MQVEAIYNQGSIQFVQPLRLKHNHIRLVVTVPDEEVVLAWSPEPLQAQKPDQPQCVSSYGARIDQILAPYQHMRKPHQISEPVDCRAIWEEHLTDKHLANHEKSDI